MRAASQSALLVVAGSAMSRNAAYTTVEGAGPALVLVHGVAGSRRVWDLVVPDLRRDHCVVRTDLLGYGRSPAPKGVYTVGAHLDAIRRGLDGAGVPRPVVLVGLSMGGTLVLEYARRWPEEVRSVVVVGLPWYPDDAAARSELRQDPWVRQAIDHPRLAALWVTPLWAAGRSVPGLAGAFSSIYTPAMARDALRVPYRVFASTVHHVMIGHRPEPALAATSGMERLFLHGEEDRWTPADRVAALVSGAARTTVERYSGVGHNLAVLAPARVAASVRRFATGAAPGAGAQGSLVAPSVALGDPPPCR